MGILKWPLIVVVLLLSGCVQPWMESKAAELCSPYRGVEEVSRPFPQLITIRCKDGTYIRMDDRESTIKVIRYSEPTVLTN